ncbi:hypothetical protein WA158_001586 [Blastocystis sp. Blastoise]
MLPPGHYQTTLALYRSILREGKQFPDIIGSSYIHWRARMLFRRYSKEVSTNKVNEYLSNGRKYLRQIERANHGDYKSFERIIQSAYCTRGRLYHILWWRIENEHKALIGIANDRTEIKKYRYGRHFYLKAMSDFSDLPPEIEDWIRTCIIIYTEDWLKKSQLKTSQPNKINVKTNKTDSLDSLPKVKYQLPPCIQLYLQQCIVDKERFYKRRFLSIATQVPPVTSIHLKENTNIHNLVELLMGTGDSTVENNSIPVKINKSKESSLETLKSLPVHCRIDQSYEVYDEEKEAENILNSDWFKRETNNLLKIMENDVSVRNR